MVENHVVGAFGVARVDVGLIAPPQRLDHFWKNGYVRLSHQTARKIIVAVQRLQRVVILCLCWVDRWVVDVLDFDLQRVEVELENFPLQYTIGFFVVEYNPLKLLVIGRVGRLRPSHANEQQQTEKQGNTLLPVNCKL